jgi:hypothetical protein
MPRLQIIVGRQRERALSHFVDGGRRQKPAGQERPIDNFTLVALRILLCAASNSRLYLCCSMLCCLRHICPQCSGYPLVGIGAFP